MNRVTYLVAKLCTAGTMLLTMSGCLPNWGHESVVRLTADLESGELKKGSVLDSPDAGEWTRPGYLDADGKLFTVRVFRDRRSILEIYLLDNRMFAARKLCIFGSSADRETWYCFDKSLFNEYMDIAYKDDHGQAPPK